MFEKFREKGRKALVPFLTAGYPSKRKTIELLDAAAATGVDAVEIGIPFSDPLADGPEIQAASQKALEAGITPDDAFDIVRAFRRRHGTPLFFMTYANPVVRMGIERFFRRCREEGVDGVILPDVPPEEGAAFEGYEVPLVYLCSPTCSARRIRKIAGRSGPFVYLVSLKGVTGVREVLPKDLEGFVRRVRHFTRKPLFVGFGISTPEHARAVTRLADGVIIGSAILRRAGRGMRPVRRFLTSLRRAIDR